MYIPYRDRIFVTHECVNLVVLLPFPHLPLLLPLPIFPAQFAYYRQRKTKSDVAQSQKKTAKRKSSSVHTHDVPKEEHALAARGLGKGMERKDEATNILETTTEVNLSYFLCFTSLFADNKYTR